MFVCPYVRSRISRSSTSPRSSSSPFGLASPLNRLTDGHTRAYSMWSGAPSANQRIGIIEKFFFIHEKRFTDVLTLPVIVMSGTYNLGFHTGFTFVEIYSTGPSSKRIYPPEPLSFTHSSGLLSSGTHFQSHFFGPSIGF